MGVALSLRQPQLAGLRKGRVKEFDPALFTPTPKDHEAPTGILHGADQQGPRRKTYLSATRRLRRMVSCARYGQGADVYAFHDAPCYFIQGRRGWYACMRRTRFRLSQRMAPSNYSYRRATIGSIREARRAGRKPASTATLISKATEAAMITGSAGAMPKSRDFV